ncbi:integrase, catalytic region, zinc finger, CCHC-type containing protein, partial [Tanacetum coccineum]
MISSSELGSELTFLAGSELRTSELDTSELKTSEYRSGSDTRPPMLDKTDFASWQQRIRLYCQGKENGVNILKSINEGPFQMGTFRETLVEEWGRFVIAVKLNRGLRDSNYDQLYAYLKQHEYNLQSSTNPSSTYVPPHFADSSQLVLGLSPSENLIENLTNTLALLTQSYKTVDRIEDKGTMHGVQVQLVIGGAQNRVGNANTGQAKQVKFYNCNGIGHIARNCTQPKRPQNSKYFKDKMLLMQAQENGVALDEEQLLFIAADDCNAFDSDVDEAPTAQTIFMANLSSADPVYDEGGPSYNSDILSEVHDLDHYQDAVYERHEEHEMHDDVQLNYV